MRVAEIPRTRLRVKTTRKRRFTKMRDRKFGIEIEHGHNGSYTEARGVLQEAGNRGDINPYWGSHCTSDGTLIEARSPILQGNAGFKELKRVFQIITESGGYVTDLDGMHVHHDAPEYVADIKLVKQLVKSWVANRQLVAKFVSSDRNGNGACPAWSSYSVTRFDAVDNLRRIDGYWGRNDLNISALTEHGTIELRLHEGTLDFAQAEAWIRFGQAFLNKVVTLKKPLKTADTHAELLRRIRAASTSRDVLLTRAASVAGTVYIELDENDDGGDGGW
jgi:hypothetical protein